MNKCKFNNHLFLLSDFEKNIFDYYNKLEKTDCFYCKSNKNVIPLLFIGQQSNSYKKVERITGKIKLGGACSKLCNWYCKKCGGYFK